MGYTHYWTFKPVPKGKAKEVEALYQQAVKECATVVRKYSKEFGGVSGYTAHTKVGQYGGIKINGSHGDECEDFILREHYRENIDGFGHGFHFTKTRRGGYDSAVVACLAILKYRLKDLIEVNSDGFDEDWLFGVNFARQVLKRKIMIPNTVEPRPQPYLRLVNFK